MSNLIGMNPALALTMVKNYTDNHLAVINDSLSLAQLRTSVNGTLSPTDSRSVWFSLEDLNTFIQQIQDGVSSANNTGLGDLGIRFYFAQYPEAGSPLWSDKKLSAELASQAQYAGMETLILVPTYNDSNGEDVDFDPNITDGNGNPLSILDIYDPNAGNLPGKICVMNHGTLCPPPWPVNGSISTSANHNGAGLMALCDL